MDFMKCVEWCPLLKKINYGKIEVTALINRQYHLKNLEPGEILYYDNIEFVPNDEDRFGICLYFKESLEPLVMYGAIQGELNSIGEDIMRLSVCSVEDLAHALKNFTLTECDLCCPNLKKEQQGKITD